MAAGSPTFRLVRLGSDRPTAPHLAGIATPIPRPRGALLPSKDTLDYVHSLTSTTMLLAAAAVFVVFGRRTPRRALRQLASKHVGAP